MALVGGGVCSSHRVPNQTPTSGFLLEEFESALARVHSQLRPTPLIRSEWLSRTYQCEVFLKLECFQPTCSFKVRGALNSLLTYRDNHGGAFPALVAAASGGSHGLAVAFASQLFAIPALIYIPENSARPSIIERLKGYGATVVVKGENYAAAADLLDNHLLSIEGAIHIHAYADRATILGQGTIALEISQQLPQVLSPEAAHFDALIASVGGGGLLGGISTAWRLLENTPSSPLYSTQDSSLSSSSSSASSSSSSSPSSSPLSGSVRKETQIISVETQGADCWFQSLEKKTLTRLPGITSIAKTLGASQTTPQLFEMLLENVDTAVRVSDTSALQSLRDLLTFQKILVEPATSCTVAALPFVLTPSHKTVCIIICGANCSLDDVIAWEKELLTS